MQKIERVQMAVIVARGGRGGKGCAIKRTPKHNARSFPTGGKGGRGGDVIVVSRPELPPNQHHLPITLYRTSWSEWGQEQ